MQHIYLSHYEGTSEALFDHDLDDKDEVLLLRADGELAGFTTYKVYSRRWNGREIRVVYSGDTIVDREHWGQQALAYAWIGRMGEIKRQSPVLPLYWFLLVKGHRTFKYMPAFGRSFYPHWSEKRDDLKPLADLLAGEMFPNDYNPASGVVEFHQSHGHLKSGLADPSPEESGRDAVRFFLSRNPGYKSGHELVCICELEEENMKPLTRRLFLKGAD